MQAALNSLEFTPAAPAVMEVLNDLPRLRSQLSKEPDSPEAWRNAPKLKDFPVELLPEHKNAVRARENYELFNDRFRVQHAV